MPSNRALGGILFMCGVLAICVMFRGCFRESIAGTMVSSSISIFSQERERVVLFIQSFKKMTNNTGAFVYD